MSDRDVLFRFHIRELCQKLIAMGISKRRLSPSALAEATGVSRPTVSKLLEEDCSHNLSVDGLARFGLYWGVDPNVLISWNQQALSPQTDPEMSEKLRGQTITWGSYGEETSVVPFVGTYNAALIAEGETEDWIRQCIVTDERMKEAVEDRGAGELCLLLDGGHTLLGRGEAEPGQERWARVFRFDEGPKPRLSRSHLMLLFLPALGHLIATDLGSTNHTYIGRDFESSLPKPLEPSRPVFLEHGDILYLGGDSKRRPARMFRVSLKPIGSDSC